MADRQFPNSLLNDTEEEIVVEDQTEEVVLKQEEEEVAPLPRVRVRIGDSYREVDQELADMLEAERKKRDDDAFRKISEQGEKIKQLSDRIAQYDRPKVDPEEDSAEDVEYYKSPSKSIEARLEKERKAIKEEVSSELTQKYNQEQEQQRYAAQFYGSYKHLVGREDLVANIYNVNVDKLNGLTWEKQHELISKLVDEQVIKWTGSPLPRESVVEPKKEKEVKKSPVTTKPVVSERSGGKAPVQLKVEQEESDDIDDLSEFLKNERARTRRARMA